jgi:hypothetical protein
MDRIAGSEPLQKMEVHHDWNSVAHRPDSAAGGGIAHLAAQQELGVLPEWRPGTDPAHPAHPAALGQDISGLCGSGKKQAWKMAGNYAGMIKIKKNASKGGPK